MPYPAMVFYFRLQYSRLIRILKSFGINPYLAMVFGGLLFIWLSSSLFKRLSYPEYIYTGFALIACLQTGQTARNEFLTNIYTKSNYRRLRLFENLALVLPFAVFLLFKGFYACSLVTIFLGLFLSFYNRIGSSVFVIPSPFYRRPFEFTIGWRKYYGAFVLTYTLAGLAVSVGNFNLAVFAYVVLLLTCMSFYTSADPLFYVWVHAQKPSQFLKSKMTTAMRYSLYTTLPMSVAVVYFFPLNAWIVIGVSICGAMYVLLGVVAKYSNYPHQTNLLQIIMMSVGLVFPPLLLALIPYFFITSTKKLTPYLK